MGLPEELLADKLRGIKSPQLRHVSKALDATLSAAGYSERAYYAVRSGGRSVGFALVTRLERIETDGKPFPPDERFLPATSQDRFSLVSFLKSLFVAPVGYYRLLAFVVATESIKTDDRRLDQQGAEALLRKGDRRLRGCLAETPFTDDYSIDVLVYEFRHAPEEAADENVAQLAPGRLDPALHLSRAGVFSLDQLRNAH